MSKYLLNGISSNQICLPPFTQIIMLNFWRRVYKKCCKRSVKKCVINSFKYENNFRVIKYGKCIIY